MARNTKDIIIDKGRDAGKKFKITEPNAIEGEALFMKMLSLCDGQISVNSLLKTEEGTALWNKLMDYVQIYPTPNADLTRKPDQEDIEEFTTYMSLKQSVLALFTGF